MLNSPKVDLRQNYDEKVEVKGGTLYRNGNIIQVWWHHLGEKGHETWTNPDLPNTLQNFNDMKERWNED